MIFIYIYETLENYAYIIDIKIKFEKSILYINSFCKYLFNSHSGTNTQMFKIQTKGIGHDMYSGIYTSVKHTNRVIRGVTNVPGNKNLNGKDIIVKSSGNTEGASKWATECRKGFVKNETRKVE